MVRTCSGEFGPTGGEQALRGAVEHGQGAVEEAEGQQPGSEDGPRRADREAQFALPDGVPRRSTA